MRVNPFASIFVEVGQFFRRSTTEKNQALSNFSIPKSKEDRVTLSDRAIQKLSDTKSERVELGKVTTSSYYFIERKVPKVELLDGPASAFHVHNNLEFLRLNKTSFPNVESLAFKPSFIDKQIKSFLKISQKLLNLRESLITLRNKESLNIKSAKSSNPGALTVTTSRKSPVEDFRIKIFQLAAGNRLVSDPVADPFASLEVSGTIQINGFEIIINESDSLNDIKNKINFGEDTNKNGILDLGEDLNKNSKLEILKVPSTPFSKGLVIVEDINGDNIIQGSEDLNNNELLDGGIEALELVATISGNRLILNSISEINKNIQLQDDNNILLDLGFFELDRLNNPVLKEQQLDPETFENFNKQSASSFLTIDGRIFIKKVNDISDIVPETTLSLKDTSLKDISLSISADINSALKNIKTFINAYNEVINFLNKELTFDRVLEGNVAVQKIRTGLNDRAVDDILNADQKFNNLNKIGITSRNQSKNTFNEVAIKNLVTNFKKEVSNILTLPPKGSNSIFIGMDKIGIRTKEDDTLILEERKLKKILKNNIEEVITIFTEASSGISKKLNGLIDIFTRPLSGTISMQVDNLSLFLADSSFASELINNKITLMKSQLQSLKGNIIESIKG